VEETDTDKNTNLLEYGIVYIRKKFYSTSPRICSWSYKTFWSKHWFL